MSCLSAEAEIDHGHILAKGAESLHDYKFWPHVSRVDNVFGERNPACSCVGMENYTA